MPRSERDHQLIRPRKNKEYHPLHPDQNSPSATHPAAAAVNRNQNTAMSSGYPSKPVSVARPRSPAHLLPAGPGIASSLLYSHFHREMVPLPYPPVLYPL